MVIFTDESRTQFLKLLNLSDETLKKYLEIINKSISSKGSVFAEMAKYAQQDSSEIDPNELPDVYTSLYNIAKLHTNPIHFSQFNSELSSILSKEQNTKLQNIIQIMNQNNFMNKLATVHIKTRLEDSILPRLRSFNLTYNYRILEEIEGKNRLIPVIQCVLRTERDTINKSEEFTFQIVPYELDELIRDLEELKEKFKAFDHEFGV